MNRGMRLFVWGGLGMLVFGLVSLSRAGEGAFMDERFIGTLFSFIGACWLIGPITSTVSRARRRAKEQRLFSTGRTATAVVERLETTATTINMMPLVKVTVRVDAADRPPFSHTFKLITPASAMPTPGDVVEVAYNPDDPSDIVVKSQAGFDAALGSIWARRKAERAVKKESTLDSATRLDRLSKLRESGALTDAEFEQAKEQLG